MDMNRQSPTVVNFSTVKQNFKHRFAHCVFKTILLFLLSSVFCANAACKITPFNVQNEACSLLKWR